MPSDPLEGPKYLRARLELLKEKFVLFNFP